MMLKRLAFIATLFLFSCGNKNDVPNGIIKPEKMQLVLWDVLRADVFAFDFITKDTSKKAQTENIKLQQQVFAIHKVSREEFYESFAYYKAHPGLMQPMLDSLVNKANREKFIATQAKITVDSIAKKTTDSIQQRLAADTAKKRKIGLQK